MPMERLRVDSAESTTEDGTWTIGEITFNGMRV